MTQDVVKALGYLCLGSRFRRIGERLQANTQEIIARSGVNIQAGQYPYVAAIDLLGPLTVGELAVAVGVSQPGATRTVSQLVDLGYVMLRPSPDDQRRRLVSLTAEGLDLVAHSRQAVWPLIEEAVAGLCNGLSGPLLEQLAAIETGLDDRPLITRSKLEKE